MNDNQIFSYLYMVRHKKAPSIFRCNPLYVVALEGYAYMVPHVVEDDICFLKTIIPSRVHTKHFFTE